MYQYLHILVSHASLVQFTRHLQGPSGITGAGRRRCRFVAMVTESIIDTSRRMRAFTTSLIIINVLVILSLMSLLGLI